MPQAQELFEKHAFAESCVIGSHRKRISSQTHATTSYDIFMPQTEATNSNNGLIGGLGPGGLNGFLGSPYERDYYLEVSRFESQTTPLPPSTRAETPPLPGNL